jgi:hypothetical protein
MSPLAYWFIGMMIPSFAVGFPFAGAVPGFMTKPITFSGKHAIPWRIW